MKKRNLKGRKISKDGISRDRRIFPFSDTSFIIIALYSFRQDHKIFLFEAGFCNIYILRIGIFNWGTTIRLIHYFFLSILDLSECTTGLN